MRCLILLLLLAMPLPSAAQTTPDAGATQMVRAAGMPLNDGALAPGTLTVRVVQGTFTGNLSGLTVELTIDGQAPKQAATGPDGRAEFAHLPVGSRVQASAGVGAERLVSDTFAMPAESGVRLLLVAGGDFVDTTTKESAALAAASSAEPAAREQAAAATAAAMPVSAAASNDAQVAAFRIFMIGATIVAFLIVAWRQVKG
ncbi:MAG: hypothetical protein R2712_29310 [Vicinamibacterales bacterium]